MEGYFWRLTDGRAGRVVVALCGVCRDAGAGRWAVVALAAHPGGLMACADLPRAGADPRALGVWAADDEGRVAFRADADRLDVDLGPGARLHVRLVGTPGRRTALGGLGAAHLLPGLSQYWHPHVLGGEADGTAVLGDETVSLAGARVYAEKNWGAGGFPARWWWGQAHDFPDDDVAVAFAGGEVGAGPVRLAATGLVVTLGDRMIRLGNPALAPARMAVDGRRWSLHARGPRWSVAAEGRGGVAAHVLPVPDLAARRSRLAAHEHLAGTVSLVVRRRGRVMYAGDSPLAGLEVGRRSDADRGEQLGGFGG